MYACDDCHELAYSYHSCVNRNCPKCQNEQAEAWLQKQAKKLLPVPYFLLTFTLPAELRKLARAHQKLFYEILFKASAQAMQKLAGDPKFIGGTIGFLGVLHTWAPDMRYHPHVHYLVPGGGLSGDKTKWLPAQNKFFLPVQALSPIFRAKFRDALKQTSLFKKVSACVWHKDWVVHCNGRETNQGTILISILSLQSLVTD